ncbi:Bcl2-associated agonist of cell death [Camelus dromedarius]|uniref:Bcl2-associated agonist of cell death n=1 Tax=Camelus dromedarius TaxID=9838 RepID=A0A5N4BXY7_CAMDR|nr:Bcl2-associated agonist of cell death [Camelus dromedarius]
MDRLSFLPGQTQRQMGAWEAGCALTTCHLASTAQSMFQIPEFEQSEQEESSPADRGLGPNPTGDRAPGPGKHCRTATGLLGEAGHQQGQPANSNYHGGAGAVETRSRHSSHPTGTEDEEGTEEEEPSPFRGRSRSAPPNLWAAQRYGRELRRMSDEFHGSFKVSARMGARVPVVLEHAGDWTPSPEERWHRDTDAAKSQLDALHPVLVGPELGERRLRPLPVNFRPIIQSAAPPLVAILGVGGSLFCRPYAKIGSISSLSEGSGLTQSPIPFRGMRTTEALGPHRKF